MTWTPPALTASVVPGFPSALRERVWVGEGPQIACAYQGIKVLEYFAQLPSCLIGVEAYGSAHYWARESAMPVARSCRHIEAACETAGGYDQK
jgi:hypothetical protein